MSKYKARVSSCLQLFNKDKAKDSSSWANWNWNVRYISVVSTWPRAWGYFSLSAPFLLSHLCRSPRESLCFKAHPWPHCQPVTAGLSFIPHWSASGQRTRGGNLESRDFHFSGNKKLIQVHYYTETCWLMENTEKCQSGKYQFQNHCLLNRKTTSTTFWALLPGAFFPSVPIDKYRNSNDVFSKGNIF